MARVGRLDGDLVVVPAWVRRGVGGHHDPVQAWGLKQVPQDRGLWLDLPATLSWDSTAPVAWSMADSR